MNNFPNEDHKITEETARESESGEMMKIVMAGNV